MTRNLLIAAVAFVSLAATPVSFAPGLSFTIRSSTSKDAAASTSSSGTRVQALNGVLRFEGEEGKAGADGKGSYVIVNPKTKSLSMVMPEQQQYIEINFADSVADGLGAMASMMAATTMVSDIQVSGASLGGGGVVNGYSTSRYRITTSFAEMAGGTEGQRKVRMVEDFWVTDQLKDIPDPMEAFTRAFGGQNGMPQVGGTMGELMKKRGEAQRKLFTGLPLKSVVQTTATDRDGSTTEETTTTEIVDLRKIDVDPAAFTVPTTYAKMDMKSFMDVGAQMRNALRSLGGKSGTTSGTSNGSLADDMAKAAKDGAKEAVDETKQEAKDGAKEAAKSAADSAKAKAKCALGGMFGRRKC